MRFGIRQQVAKHEVARQSREKWPPVVLLDLRARCFHQLAVFDARGARRLARAAIQALIDMLYEGVAERQAALVHQHDLADSPARRIGFEAPELVGRAMIQTQAAVHTVRVVVIRGDVRAGKSAPRFWAGSLFRDCGCDRSWPHIPPAKRPGAKTFCGSKECFTRRINPKSGREGPSTMSADVFIAVGHHSNIAEACISGALQVRKTSPMTPAMIGGADERLSSAGTRRRKFPTRGRAQQSPDRAARQPRAVFQAAAPTPPARRQCEKSRRRGRVSIISMGNSRMWRRTDIAFGIGQRQEFLCLRRACQVAEFALRGGLRRRAGLPPKERRSRFAVRCARKFPRKRSAPPRRDWRLPPSAGVRTEWETARQKSNAASAEENDATKRSLRLRHRETCGNSRA